MDDFISNLKHPEEIGHDTNDTIKPITNTQNWMKCFKCKKWRKVSKSKL